MIVDISPSTLSDKYPDKNGTAKMLYMAFTCARKYQPAIIYIDEIEEIFKAGKKKKKKKKKRRFCRTKLCKAKDTT